MFDLSGYVTSASRERFTAPTAAFEVRTTAARCVILGVIGVAAALAFGLHGEALWATPAPEISVLVLATLATLLNRVGEFNAVGGLAEYTTFAAPINFAMLLVLDWRHFVVAVAVAELLTFVAEASTRTNPTIWYVRCLNVATLVVAGAAASEVSSLMRPLVATSVGSWTSPFFALTLAGAALVWRTVDYATPAVIVALAAEMRPASIRVPFRAFCGHFAVLLIGIPFAWFWHSNVWLAFLPLASLGVAHRLVKVPELEYHAWTDGLSGLMNARAFERALDREIASKRPSQKLALLALDVDHFKSINDTFGHLIGDAVIVHLGSVLTGATRRKDVAARTGGEEFSLLLRDGDRERATAFAERLRQSIADDQFSADGMSIPIGMTVSIGVAMFPDDGETARDVRIAADEALYAAKNAGRNAVRCAGPAVPVETGTAAGER